MKKILLSAAFVITSSTASAAGETLWSPDQGVICDRVAQFCADGTGVSATFTEEYLGPQAAKAVAKKLKANGYDSSKFTFSTGAHCNINKRRCTVAKGNDKIDPVTDGVLFHQ